MTINVFEILQAEDELSHNRMLFFLLDDIRSQEGKRPFYSLFFRKLGHPEIAESPLEQIVPEYAQRPMYAERMRRPDFLISTNRHHVVIENKVKRWSIDLEQLEEEYKYGQYEAERAGKEFWMIYISPLLPLPNQEDAEKPRLLLVDWQFVLDCITEVQLGVQGPVKEVLTQYAEWIRQSILERARDTQASIDEESGVYSILFPARHRRLLFNLFLFNPRQMFYPSQIARMTGSYLHSIQNELAHFEEMQLVTKRRSGRNVYYSLNERNPICPILRELIRRSTDI